MAGSMRGGPSRSANPTLQASEVPSLWRASRRLSWGVAILLFPLVFILDQHADFGFSPVLPALLVLILLMIAGPMGAFEVLRRTWGAKGAGEQRMRIHRLTSTANFVLGGSILLFLLWLSLGA